MAHDFDRKPVILIFRGSGGGVHAARTGLAGNVHVHLEASELAGWIRRVLTGRAARVVISHATTNAWIAKDPRKRESLDAFTLAELLRLGRVHEVYYPDEEHRAVFKQLVQHYGDIVAQQIRLKLKIEARLRTQGVIVRGQGAFRRTGPEATLHQAAALAVRQAVAQLYTLFDHTVTAQHETLKLLRRHARQYPEIARFQTVPGIGLISAVRLSASMQTPHRFRSKRKLWRYCRLGITERSSDGKRLGPKRLDPTGLGCVKDVSRKAFLSALRTRSDNAVKRCSQQALARTHNATPARLTTQRKIVAVLRAMWKGGTEYQDHKGAERKDMEEGTDTRGAHVQPIALFGKERTPRSREPGQSHGSVFRLGRVAHA